MSNLWQVEAMIAAMKARPHGDMPDGIHDISIDTRSLQKGDAYFAIKGDVHDGHAFLTGAQRAGAALGVVSEEKLPSLGAVTLPLLVVDDVLVALEQLGMAARERTNAKIIAVTGSVGKTSTKEALRHMLAANGKVHASVASFNNHWGVPLTLSRMPQDAQFGIFEIGMNHPGEISPLVRMVRPHIALITNVEAAHLGAFSGIEEIAKAKAEIFDGLVPGGSVVLNRDNAYYEYLASVAKDLGFESIVGFGKCEGAEVRLKKVKLHDRCSCVMVDMFGEEAAIKVGAPGRHVVQNILGCLAVVKLAGADMTKSVLALGDMTVEKGRGTRHELLVGGGKTILIDESYNANPASMRAAIAMLEAAHPEKRGRRIAVLGDMLELGEKSGELHEALAKPLETAAIDQVFLVGPEMQHLAETLQATMLASYVPEVEDVKSILFSALRTGDVVMLKASKGVGFAGLVEDLVKKFRNQ